MGAFPHSKLLKFNTLVHSMHYLRCSMMRINLMIIECVNNFLAHPQFYSGAMVSWGGGRHSTFCMYMVTFPLKSLPLKGQLFVLNIPLQGQNLYLTLKGTIHYKMHTLKKGHKMTKTIPLRYEHR